MKDKKEGGKGELKKIIFTLLFLMLTGGINAFGEEREVIVPIEQDTYIETTAMGADYSNSSPLQLINARVRKYAYMMFDLSGIEGHITEAKLVFEAKSSSDITPGKIRLRKAESNWTDRTLCFENQPIHTYPVSDPEFIEIPERSYKRYEHDITELAQRENAQSKKVSLRIEPEEQEVFIMSAETMDEKRRPHLFLKVDDEQTPHFDEAFLYTDEEAVKDMVKYALNGCIAIEAGQNVCYKNGRVELLVGGDYNKKSLIRNERLLIPIDTARDSITEDCDGLTKTDIDGYEYVYVREAAEKAGKICEWRNGITVIGDSIKLSDGLWEKLPEVLHGPFAANIITELKKNNPDKKHPRLMATADDFERIRRLNETDERVKKWVASLRKTADATIDAKPSEHILPNNTSMLAMSRQIQERVELLALMYNITGEEKYAERAWLEIDTALDFPDWNPYHFLDTAELSDGIAIGYDWLYDWLGEERRAKIREVLRVRTFEEIMKDLSGADVKRYSNWATSENYGNWHLVCPGGATMSALAVGDEEGFEEITGTVIETCIKMLKRSVKSYSPDGGWDEGVGYWSLATKYLVKSLSAFDTAIDKDYGLYSTSGVGDTAYFPTFVTGPMGTFNIGDDNVVASVSAPELFWFADKKNDPELAFLRRNVVDKGRSKVTVFDVVWYKPDECSDSAEEFNLDKYFGGVEIVSMRSRWNDSDAMFVGFHAGDNNSGHCDLDVGTFVLDAFGVRWAEDLGKDDYNLPGYFERNHQRWNYYSKRAEGHNTLLINPGDTKDQATKAFCEIYKFESKPKGSIAIADMSEAYKYNAKSVKRGIMLSENRSSVTIQDEIELLKESEIWWQMHTRTEIEITNNGRTAVLASGGKKLLATLEYPINASFDVIPASPFSFMPNPEGQKSLSKYKKLAVNIKSSGNVTIKISFREYEPNYLLQIDEAPPVPVDRWEIADGELERLHLDGIYVNNEPLSGFDKNKYSYTYEVASENAVIPEVKAQSGYGYKIYKPQSIPGEVVIALSDGKSINSRTYYRILVSKGRMQKPLEGFERIEIKSVEASVIPQPENTPENTLDASFDTRWSASGEPWIMYDFGEKKKLNAVGLAWYQGDSRKTKFDIEVSGNGVVWTAIYRGESSGDTNECDYYDFDNISARYVRIKGYGADTSAWTSLTEFEAYTAVGGE